MESKSHKPALKCKAITKTGEQCKNNAIPDKNCCYLKAHGEVKIPIKERMLNFLQNNLIFLLGMVLITVIGFIISCYMGYRYFYDESRRPSQGQISGKVFDDRKPLIVYAGNNSVAFEPESFKDGFNFNEIIVTDYSFPIKIYTENNQIMVDLDIYNNKGLLVGSITRNEWTVNPIGIYDKNFNSTAFEIVDADRIPLFQLQFKEINSVYFGGYILRDDGLYNVYGTNSFILGVDKETVKRESKRIFQYPSSDFPGKLNMGKQK